MIDPERQEKCMKRHKRKKVKYMMAGCVAVLLLLFVAVFAYMLLMYQENKSAQAGPASGISQTSEDKSTYTDHGWNLILVNDTHYIPKDYSVDLIELSNGEKVDSRIYPKLQEMFDAARADGLSLFVAAGYRTRERQQELMDEKIREYLDQGYSQEEAQRLAGEWVATPGTSEHELGIAVDINADTSTTSSDELYQWLADNAWRYGFIKRYSEEKSDITGVINEPWHYRYVGEDAAREITSRGLCLEEYIETL